MRIKSTSLFFTAALALLSAPLLTASVSAGEIVRLKAGEIRLQDTSQILLREASGFGRMSQEPKYFVVQFTDRISEKNKELLSQQGLEPKGYLPDDALIVRGEQRAAGVSGFLPFVRAVVPFQPEWKISAELYESTSARSELIVLSIMDSKDVANIRSELATIAGLKIKFVGEQTIIVRTSRAEVNQIAKIEGISWIESMPVFVTFDFGIDADNPPVTPPAITGYESGTRLMNFEMAWQRGFSGEGQIVGMADTGVDSGSTSTMHPDLSAVTKGYAMGFGSSSWEDTNGHGTHVCGSVIGNGRASDGKIRGGAHSASMVVDGLWSPIMDNLAFKNDFNFLLGAPYKDGVRIHTNSWGAANNLGAYDTFAAAADAYMWNNPDMLILFAAGNSGEDKNRDGRIDENSVCSPGTAKNVLTVGASENLLAEGGIQKPIGQLRDGDKKWGVEPIKSDTLSNNPDGMAAFSSRGPTNDGRLKPEIVAPGTNIVSVKSQHPKAGKLWGEFSKDYVYAGGTSMATPLTAGAAVVVREYLVKTHQLTNPSAALVKAAMLHSATDMYPGQYGTGPNQELPTRRPNVHEGYGRVNVDAGTNLVSTVLVDDKTGIGLSEEKSVKVNVGAGGSLHATLSYTDAPGAATSSKALVNDIDLRVIDPSGKIYELADRKNNSEMLELSNLAAGDYEVIVKGINVPQGKDGKQPYALLITN
ncbi:MAG: hypothetical protein A2428_09955 [Bdellovibrionales bacterium RIFOXYC1_FULL_54_43]|nr:MAG: hypothetical protein A2428_09955 [Bdellovibrionales bacterium RIFOXYC1_FULL_54_43]OFZ79360.1 MAG: hypothetical protein A2603_07670 [Bdellovibrionales bacterium RIFOXYD1_FULL_55_31]